MTEKRSKYSLLGRINFEDLYNAFLGLEQRQQTFIVIGGAFLCLLLVILPISCASSKLSALRQDYEKSREGMATLMNKIRDYQTSQEALESIKKELSQAAGQSVTTILETLANEEGIGANIDKLKPVNLGTSDFFDEIGVDASFSKVTLPQMTSYLFRIENHETLPMKVKKLQIKPRYGSRQSLNVTFQVSTVQLKKEATEGE